MSLKFHYLSALLLGATLLGCGGASREGAQATHKVTGKITQGGAPVADATVTFSPTGDQPPAFGRTGTDGTYTLTTYDSGDGAAAGSYKVRITKSDGGAGVPGPPAGHDPNNPSAFKAPPYPGQSRGSGSVLPEQYAKDDTTPLTAVVSADGENRFDFDL